MTISMFPNGLGGSLGSRLATCKPLLVSGSVFYVDTTAGDDAQPGTNREAPLLTLAQAVTNSAAGDLIVLINASEVAITGAQSISGRVLVGEGQSGGVPDCSITFDGAGTLTMGAAGGELRNVRVSGRTAAGGGLCRVLVSASTQLIEDCYFECAENDDGAAVEVSTTLSGLTLRGCTFVSTATTDTRPVRALSTLGAHTDLTIEDTLFDAGVYGWSATWALDLGGGAITRLKGLGITLLRGADFGIHPSSTGYFNVQLATGGSRGSW